MITYKEYFMPIPISEVVDMPPMTHNQPTGQVAKSPVIDNKKLTNAYIVAATLFGEARSEGLTGMQAILNVIMNRAHGDFNNAAKVASKPKQFSCWNNINNKEEYANILAKKARSGELKDANSYKSALMLVDKALKNNLPDITGGAQFYFNPHKVHPRWADKMTITVTLGNHEFYKLK